LGERLHVTLVLLLMAQRLEARRVLGVDAGLLDLGVADRLEAGLILARALLLHAAALVFGAEALLLLFTRAALGRLSRLDLGVRLRAARGLLLLDAILLEVHQLFEGEKDRAFFLFRHG
jgi:hypothetical protein